jgi:hypothetical protein
MIPRETFETLDAEEKKLWHSHGFEVKSGMLIMPKPSTSLLPETVWEKAETKEMEEVATLYGKTFHFWEVSFGGKGKGKGGEKREGTWLMVIIGR